MSRRDLSLLALGAGIGAWIFPIATYLADRAAGRHFLAIVAKENEHR